MTQREMLTLYADKALNDFIKAQARRHFSNEEDRKDAVSLAWERIMSCDVMPTSMVELEIMAYRGIKNFYDREHRRKQKIISMRT